MTENKSIIEIAKSNYREYITPEDVTEAIKSGTNINDIRLEVLEIIGGMKNFGIEDSSLCAFIAAKGKN